MEDLNRRYSRLMRQTASLFREDESLVAFLAGLKVNREEWNPSRSSGRFFFQDSPAHTCVEFIELIAHDQDGVIIEVAVHITGERTNWGEWYRSDRRPVLRWPALSFLPKSRYSTRIHEVNGESGADSPDEAGRFRSRIVRQDRDAMD